MGMPGPNMLFGRSPFNIFRLRRGGGCWDQPKSASRRWDQKVEGVSESRTPSASAPSLAGPRAEGFQRGRADRGLTTDAEAQTLWSRSVTPARTLESGTLGRRISNDLAPSAPLVLDDPEVPPRHAVRRRDSVAAAAATDESEAPATRWRATPPRSNADAQLHGLSVAYAAVRHISTRHGPVEADVGLVGRSRACHRLEAGGAGDNCSERPPLRLGDGQVAAEAEAVK